MPDACKSDPPGTLEPEVSVIAGTGSQPDTANRWGDYSAMRLDPDGCTFWYTTEYYMVTQRFDWSTQIANIRFAGCHNPAYDGYIELCKQTDPDYPVTGTFNFTLTAPFFSTGPIGGSRWLVLTTYPGSFRYRHHYRSAADRRRGRKCHRILV